MLAHGPEGIALDAVITDARVSRTAFYGNFSDRDALIEALIERETDRIVPPHLDGLPFNEAITAFGERLLRFLVDPDMIGFEKLAATIEPGLPTRFYEAGPGRSQRCLAKLIEQGVSEGVLEPLEPLICYAAAEDPARRRGPIGQRLRPTVEITIVPAAKGSAGDSQLIEGSLGRQVRLLNDPDDLELL